MKIEKDRQMCKNPITEIKKQKEGKRRDINSEDYK